MLRRIQNKTTTDISALHKGLIQIHYMRPSGAWKPHVIIMKLVTYPRGGQCQTPGKKQQNSHWLKINPFAPGARRVGFQRAPHVLAEKSPVSSLIIKPSKPKISTALYRGLKNESFGACLNSALGSFCRHRSAQRAREPKPPLSLWVTGQRVTGQAGSSFSKAVFLPISTDLCQESVSHRASGRAVAYIFTGLRIVIESY